MDSLPQISLGTAALVIFALCAGFVMLRGAMRLLIGTLVLAASLWVGLMVWQSGPGLLVEWMGKSQPWLVNGLTGAAVLLTYLILRKITKAVANPFRNDDASHPRSLTRTYFRLLFSLIPTSLLWFVGAALIHHGGSVAELRDFAAAPEKTTPDDFMVRLKSAIDSAVPASWLAKLDPTAAPDRIKLAKLITAESESARKPQIDPNTGQPIPRARIVRDPELQNLAREGNFSTLLRHPLLTKALQDPNVKKLLGELNL